MKTPTLTLQTRLLQYINAAQAHAYRVIPISYENNVLGVGSDVNSPDDLAQELSIVLGVPIEVHPVETSELDTLLNTHYRKAVSSEVSSLDFSEDFLMHILFEAKALGSSDVHFESFENMQRVRFRIDGKLLEKYIIPNESYPKMINRIKIMGGLDISEKRLPQDGRISLNTPEEDFDIRVSSLPTLHGEKLVLRILSKSGFNLELEQLGFKKSQLETYQRAIQKSHGMLLISGPTGSGKTTTLYATLKKMNRIDRNILTIEDPIEYTLEGINQVQLKENIGLDFANTLRTFLRQDPDIIMVGEIRDEATANMAIRAALTGHLVLSTIHTNSAWATISRLLDMGVPPFLIASTLHLSVAQRLVRKLCPTCKKEEELHQHHVPKGFSITIQSGVQYHAVGCSSCHHTGYKGRKAIYEVIPITMELVEHIRDRSNDIKDYLQHQKITTLQHNAWQLVEAGETSIEEVYSLLLE